MTIFERHVYIDVMSVSIANCRRNLLECEIARALAHTEAVACQVHGISAEAHRILQLLESACRCKKLHGYLPFPYRSSQKATALAAATLSESTSCSIGMMTLMSQASIVARSSP